MITTKTIGLNNILENDLLNKIIPKVAEAREESILAQLNELVVKGILVLKVEERSFYRAADSNELVYKEKVTLQLNVQEYIDKLEKENSELKSYIDKLNCNI